MKFWYEDMPPPYILMPSSIFHLVLLPSTRSRAPFVTTIALRSTVAFTMPKFDVFFTVSVLPGPMIEPVLRTYPETPRTSNRFEPPNVASPSSTMSLKV